MPVDAFISYAHADDKRREQLHKHLVMLRREGLIREWSDHEIKAGDRFGNQIDAALERSGLFIALVSPDYLASKYCYEHEFKRAQELQAARNLRIVAVVVEPCDWRNSPFSELLVLPKDGKPVSDWTNENTAYLNVVTELRRVLTMPLGAASAETSAPARAVGGTGRRLRVRQDFDAIQKAEFADEAYETMKRYFKAACAELAQASDQIRTNFEVMSPTAFTCSIVNRGRMRGGEAHITVRNGKGAHHHLGDISFVYQRHAEPGTINGWLSVTADDYNLFLKGSIDRFGMGASATTFSPKQAAESLWNAFMTQAGIEYD